MTATKRSLTTKSPPKLKENDQDINKTENEQEIEESETISSQHDRDVVIKKRDTRNPEASCKLGNIFHSCTGYKLDNFTSYTNFTNWLHRPVDASALGVFRMLYGKTTRPQNAIQSKRL